MKKHIEEHPLPQYFEQQVRINYNKYYIIEYLCMFNVKWAALITINITILDWTN
jgi:hypothetical protein